MLYKYVLEKYVLNKKYDVWYVFSFNILKKCGKKINLHLKFFASTKLFQAFRAVPKIGT